MKQPRYETVTFSAMAGGGQSLGTLADGRKCFAWGVLPGETATVRITKKKSSFVEGVAEEVLSASPERIAPRDPESYLSTSPWQIMTLEAEQRYKAQLIHEAFALHHIDLAPPDVYCDNVAFSYRNKVEFSWYSDTDAASGADTLDLAFFRRGSKGKIVVDGTSLARPEINTLAREIRDILRAKHISARQLKTLLIRCDQSGNCAWQLYTKDRLPDIITAEEAANLPAQGGEIIYSDPRSPASRVTERLARFGDITLTDHILGTPFRYATEGFFQVNLPVYEQALRDMQRWVESAATPPAPEAVKRSRIAGASAERSREISSGDLSEKSTLATDGGAGGGENMPAVIDMYAGVGSIGLSIGGDNLTLVELNEHAVREMQRNIIALGRREGKATAVLAASEHALDYITPDATIILDPPRAGLHADVVQRLRQQHPPRIIYLSCNPVTQARDVALLTADDHYHIRHAKGYNFFPRTPHIEHLIVLDKM